MFKAKSEVPLGILSDHTSTTSQPLDDHSLRYSPFSLTFNPQSFFPSFLSFKALRQLILQSLSERSSSWMHSHGVHYHARSTTTTPCTHPLHLILHISNLHPPNPLCPTHLIAFPRQNEHPHQQSQANQPENYRHNLSRASLLPVFGKGRARRRSICLWGHGARHRDGNWRSAT